MPSFRIDLDAERRLLRATVEGHWDIAVALAYKDGIRDAIGKWNKGPGRQPPLRMLIDARKAVVQSRDVNALLESQKAEVADDFCRIARLVDSALQEIQVKRLNPGPKNEVFRSEEVALAWLLAEA